MPTKYPEITTLLAAAELLRAKALEAEEKAKLAVAAKEQAARDAQLAATEAQTAADAADQAATEAADEATAKTAAKVAAEKAYRLASQSSKAADARQKFRSATQSIAHKNLKAALSSLEKAGVDKLAVEEAGENNEAVVEANSSFEAEIANVKAATKALDEKEVSHEEVLAAEEALRTAKEAEKSAKEAAKSAAEAANKAKQSAISLQQAANTAIAAASAAKAEADAVVEAKAAAETALIAAVMASNTSTQKSTAKAAAEQSAKQAAATGMSSAQASAGLTDDALLVDEGERVVKKRPQSALQRFLNFFRSSDKTPTPEAKSEAKAEQVADASQKVAAAPVANDSTDAKVHAFISKYSKKHDGEASTRTEILAEKLEAADSEAEQKAVVDKFIHRRLKNDKFKKSLATAHLFKSGLVTANDVEQHADKKASFRLK